MANIPINLLDSYHLLASVEEVTHVPQFFKDRYFSTGAEDIFAADKVLVEFKNGDEEMAPFVSRRVKDIPVERGGYEVHELQPAYIGLSRILTVDQLAQRGFGEAILPNSSEAERAARLIHNDFVDLDKRIRRREEWMSVQTILNNGLDMQEYIDAKTKGELLHIRYYGGNSDHKYTVAKKWDSADGHMYGDIRAMAKSLTSRGLKASDLIVGSNVADFLLDDPKIRELLDKNSGVTVGSLNPTIEADGVSVLGSLNFGGHKLTIICVDETYRGENGVRIPYYPANSVTVTAPECGCTKYAQITQWDYGSETPTTYAKARVPKLILDYDHDERKLRLGSRPLTVPRNYCPFVTADNVVG